jgi:hypothetical protein
MPPPQKSVRNFMLNNMPLTYLKKIRASLYVNINILRIAKIDVDNIFTPYLPTNHLLEYWPYTDLHNHLLNYIINHLQTPA